MKGVEGLEKVRQVLVPEYMTEFNCIGPACEENCCEINWLISVDKKTYTKYRKVQDPTLRPMLDQYVKRNRRNPNDLNYATLKFKKGELACVFLSEEKWCSIHRAFGIDFLCNTCALYPRQWNILDGKYELSASLSCPEVARCVMLKPEGISFVHIEEKADQRRSIKVRINTKELSQKKNTDAYIWELRAFVIEVLQNRSYSLEDRILTVGLLCKKLDEVVPEVALDKLAVFRAMLEDHSIQDMLSGVPAVLTVQTQLVKEIADLRFKYPFVKNKVTGNVFLKHLSNALSGIGYVKESSLEDVPARYKEGSENYYKPFMKEYGYMMENYLVNYVFMTMFPYRKAKKSYMDVYLILVTQFALVKMLLIGGGSFYGKLDPELVVSMVYAFITTTENNQFFLNDVHASITRNGWDTLAGMSILVKN